MLTLKLISIEFFRSPEVHMKAVNSIRCLLTSHDVDIRYHEPDLRSRVANLYLPLVAIIIDNLPKLFSWSIEGEVRIVGNSNANEHLNMILNVISDNLPNPKGPVVLKVCTITIINFLYNCLVLFLKCDIKLLYLDLFFLRSIGIDHSTFVDLLPVGSEECRQGNPQTMVDRITTQSSSNPVRSVENYSILLPIQGKSIFLLYRVSNMDGITFVPGIFASYNFYGGKM